MINIIVASSENNVIGGNNTLLWNIPEDLKRFKFITTNNNVVMGRKTYESIGRALPNRYNIIVTSKENYVANNCITVSSLEEAILKSDRRNDIYIIGGGEIYKQALEMDIIDKIYLTRVHETFEGDTYFEFDEEDFEIEEKDDRKGDEYDYTFITYGRKRK